MSNEIPLPSEMRGNAILRLSNRKRYYLHRCIKKIEGAAISGAKKEISIIQVLYDSLSPPRKRWIDQLRNIGYNIQYTIQ